MGLEPTTFELEVQRASIAPQGWVTYRVSYNTRSLTSPLRVVGPSELMLTKLPIMFTPAAPLISSCRDD